MLTMLLEMGLYVLGAIVLVYLVYALFFASGSGGKASAEHKPKSTRRFERREGESGDRRKKDIGPPPGTPERRQGSRRSRD